MPLQSFHHYEQETQLTGEKKGNKVIKIELGICSHGNTRLQLWKGTWHRLQRCTLHCKHPKTVSCRAFPSGFTFSWCTQRRPRVTFMRTFSWSPPLTAVPLTRPEKALVRELNRPISCFANSRRKSLWLYLFHLGVSRLDVSLYNIQALTIALSMRNQNKNFHIFFELRPGG